MIIMRMFVDRKEELKKLMEISKSKKPELVIIYGGSITPLKGSLTRT